MSTLAPDNGTRPSVVRMEAAERDGRFLRKHGLAILTAALRKDEEHSCHSFTLLPLRVDRGERGERLLLSFCCCFFFLLTANAETYVCNCPPGFVSQNHPKMCFCLFPFQSMNSLCHRLIPTEHLISFCNAEPGRKK